MFFLSTHRSAINDAKHQGAASLVVVSELARADLYLKFFQNDDQRMEDVLHSLEDASIGNKKCVFRSVHTTL